MPNATYVAHPFDGATHFGVIEGTVRVEEFFSPENVAAIFGEAAARAGTHEPVAA